MADLLSDSEHAAQINQREELQEIFVVADDDEITVERGDASPGREEYRKGGRVEKRYLAEVDNELSTSGTRELEECCFKLRRCVKVELSGDLKYPGVIG